MLLPPSGLVIPLEATCGPFINRVRDSLGQGIAILLAQIARTLISLRTNPDSDTVQACWALYQDLFGPGEIPGPRLVTDLACTLWMHNLVGVRLALTSVQIWIPGSCRSILACMHARLTQSCCFKIERARWPCFLL